MQSSRSQISVLKHSQGLVYREMRESKESWEKEKLSLENNLKSLRETADEVAAVRGDYKVRGHSVWNQRVM